MDKITPQFFVFVSATIGVVGCGSGTTEQQELRYRSISFLEEYGGYKTPDYDGYVGIARGDLNDSVGIDVDCEIVVTLVNGDPPLDLIKISKDDLLKCGYQEKSHFENGVTEYWGESGAFKFRGSKIVGAFLSNNARIGQRGSTKLITMPASESNIREVFGPPLKVVIHRKTRTAP